MNTIERITEQAKVYKRDDGLGITEGELQPLTYYVLADLGVEQLIDAGELSLEDATHAVVAGLQSVGQKIGEIR